MQIWSAEIKELEKFYESFKGSFPDLEKELVRLIKADDENIILLYSRRCLEVIVTDLCESELKRPPKTEPLKGIIDKLNREEKVPVHIITSMQSLNSMSTFGAHPKEFDPQQVRPVLINLTTIIQWYLKYKDTQAADKAKPKEIKNARKVPDDSKSTIRILKKRLTLLLSGLALVVVIVAVMLFIFNIIGREKQIKDLEKSIAVLPFDNLSSDEEQAWFSDGITDVIINQLSKIADLRVLGRTSTLRYKEKEEKKSLSEIGEELGVNFLIEGTVQRQGNQMRISVQLIQAINEDHLWSEIYDREYRDIFIIQSEIAQIIADELKVLITPEEKQLIQKVPTTNLTAYDFYLRGREEFMKYWLEGDREALGKAEDLCYKALEYDSTFAQAYSGLAMIYYNKHYWETYFSKDFLDSVIILTDIALSYDDHFAEAYAIRGVYCREIGNPEQAIKEYDKGIKFNPNDWTSYYAKGYIFIWVLENQVEAIVNMHAAVIRNRGKELSILLYDLGRAYLNAGFIDKAKYHFQEAFVLDGDSASYFHSLAWVEFCTENFENALKLREKTYKINTYYHLNDLPLYSTFSGHYNESYLYAEKYVKRLKETGSIPLASSHRVGFSYWQAGKYKEAEYYFNQQIKYCIESIKLGREFAWNKAAHYDLAAVYAFLGDKEKAYQYLNEVNKKQTYSLWWVTYIKHDPLFDNIREEERFQKILQNMEAKYQAEHERIRKCLEEQGIL